MNLQKTVALLTKKAQDWNAEADRYLNQRDELLVMLKRAVHCLSQAHVELYQYEAAGILLDANDLIAKIEGGK